MDLSLVDLSYRGQWMNGRGDPQSLWPEAGLGEVHDFIDDL
jgi:hypothetical protein